MPRYHRDNVSRLEDIEGLLVTAHGLVARLTDEELHVTKNCIRSALSELRIAQRDLITKWEDQDAD